MRQVIRIHAHHDLGQLNGLVGQLLADDFLMYVNVDAAHARFCRQLGVAASADLLPLLQRWRDSREP